MEERGDLDTLSDEEPLGELVAVAYDLARLPQAIDVARPPCE